MLLEEAHKVKYLDSQDKRIETECKRAFQYLKNNITEFKIFNNRYADWMNQYRILNRDIKQFIMDFDYKKSVILCEDVLWDDSLDEEEFTDGNELYVFILDNCKIKNYEGKIYLKFSKNNRILSFHEPSYDSIIRDISKAKKLNESYEKGELNSFINELKEIIDSENLDIEIITNSDHSYSLDGMRAFSFKQMSSGTKFHKSTEVYKAVYSHGNWRWVATDMEEIKKLCMFYIETVA